MRDDGRAGRSTQTPDEDRSTGTGADGACGSRHQTCSGGRATDLTRAGPRQRTISSRKSGAAPVQSNQRVRRRAGKRGDPPRRFGLPYCLVCRVFFASLPSLSSLVFLGQVLFFLLLILYVKVRVLLLGLAPIDPLEPPAPPRGRTRVPLAPKSLLEGSTWPRRVPRRTLPRPRVHDGATRQEDVVRTCPIAGGPAVGTGWTSRRPWGSATRCFRAVHVLRGSFLCHFSSRSSAHWMYLLDEAVTQVDRCGG